MANINAVAGFVTAVPRDKHFNTDHLHADLKGRSVRGGAATVFAQGVQFVLNMGSTAILARLLTPADFGLIAMVAAFTGFVGLFKDMGLSMATVQRAEITHEQVSVLFWINVAVSAVLGVVCMALAPAVALFYDQPRLVWVTVAISATFVFGGLTAQHTALLQRQMRFGMLAMIDIAATAAGIAAAIALALGGARYWALVAMIAAQAVAGMFGTWFASGWWPGLLRRQSGVISMLKFGGQLTGFNVLNYFTRNLDNVLIGAYLGAGPLGMYSKAYNLLMLPIRQISSPMGAVAMPALCHLQGEPARYRSYYLRALEIIAFCGIPLVIFAAVEARQLVLLVLGAQWGGAVPLFWALTPAALFGTINVAGGWVYQSLGRTDRQFRQGAVVTALTVTGFFVGIRHGALGVAIAFSIVQCVTYPFCIAYAFHGSPVRVRDLGARLWRPAVAACLSAGLLCAVRHELEISPLGLQIAASCLMFGVLYLGLLTLLPGGALFLSNAAIAFSILKVHPHPQGEGGLRSSSPLGE